jgi:large subunit ribosomal protein L6
MSRIGKQPIDIPNGVKAAVTGQTVNVEGPKGKLSFNAHDLMTVSIVEEKLVVERADDGREARSIHGLTRTLVANMVEGVSNGYTKVLEINGVGYRAEPKGKGIKLALGFSHPIEFDPLEGVSIDVDKSKTRLTISSIDKQLLGATAAKIRSYRPPEPYRGKGIKYENEHIRRKEGKSAGK